MNWKKRELNMDKQKQRRIGKDEGSSKKETKNEETSSKDGMTDFHHGNRLEDQEKIEHENIRNKDGTHDHQTHRGYESEDWEGFENGKTSKDQK